MAEGEEGRQGSGVEGGGGKGRRKKRRAGVGGERLEGERRRGLCQGATGPPEVHGTPAAAETYVFSWLIYRLCFRS